MSGAFPGTLKLLGWMIYDELNWFRIHLLAFIIVPFIFSGFVVAANPSSTSERQKTQYIDSLFLCFSAMTGTGLETVIVSGMRPIQQVFLVFLMIVGDLSVVSLITIFCRQVWLRRNCKSAVKTKRLSRPKTRKDGESKGAATPNAPVTNAGVTTNSHHQVSPSSTSTAHPVPTNHTPIESGEEQNIQMKHRNSGKRREKEGIHAYPGALGFEERERLRRRAQGLSDDVHELRHHSIEMPKTYSVIPHAASGRAAHTGRGGFPGPHRLVAALIRAISPKTAHQVYNFIGQDPKIRSLRWAHPIQSFEETVEPSSFEKRKDAQEARHAEKVKWLPPGVRGVVVGRNSQIFDEELDVEDLELFAAIEYRALTLLIVLVFVHQFLFIILPWIVIAIYFAKVHGWDATFLAKGQEQIGTVSKVWYSLFQSIAAYTSCGMSLVDSSMIPFQACYLLIHILLLPLLAGNQAMPSFLRLELWIFSKFVTPGSELDVLVHFLLTHSRRMFIYLLPSYQTWWLVVIQTLFIAGGLLGYIVFNIGLEFYKRFSGWQNFSVGLFQSLSIRSAGFEIVDLTEIAPALQVLYLFAMFTSNYPLVMAIRSTNVYEERALGMHTRDLVRTPSEKLEREIFSKYVIDHLLPQIAFDLWPIVLATGAICVVERAQLLVDEGSGWFTIWRIVFEVTSGYATVGASFGYPASYLSFSGSFRKISKLIMILLMLRGRHRGLPSAIDRATMLPVEYLRINTDNDEKAEEDRVEVMQQTERVRRQ